MMLGLLLVLSLPTRMLGFQPLLIFDGKSITHRDITKRAVLRKTVEVCRDVAAAQGWAFNLTLDDDLSPDDVQKACSSPGASTSLMSSICFYTSIETMCMSNANVDVLFALSSARHFDDENFHGGRNIITTGVSAVKASVKQENFVAARWTLGGVFHTLQDFYSHSNWVEMGRSAPYSPLIRPDQPLEQLAGPTTPTCRKCVDGNCNDNLLPEVLQQGLLTSGYFSIFFSKKPSGKCSHGNLIDRTSRRDPVGGINKDSAGSSHGSLHRRAADLAVSATAELLQDIRVAVGDKAFLRLMGLSYSSALCFVIDTTGSMSNEISEAKRVSFHIIDSKRRTKQEPSAYILVPFNDPYVGPVTKTTDANVFKNRIAELSASGGGDIPEMSLSGLQLALTAAPPSSEIFVFTDAPAKDTLLTSTITALIESTKSVVSFILTDVLAGQQPHRRSLYGSPTKMSSSDVRLYQDLAQASGGQTIEVSESALAQATTVIEDAFIGAVVTVFQAVMNPARPENFTFTVDSSLRNIIVYITGSSNLTFSVTSPTGVSQSSSKIDGPLASIMTAGNLHRLNLSTERQTGSWQINVESQSRYSIKVTGQSSLNFIYNLVEEHKGGGHRDFSLMDGRPLSGSNVSLLVSVTGSDKAKVTEVMLFDSSGSAEVIGSLQSIGRGTFLVMFNSIPAGDFVVCLKGEETSSTSTSPPIRFQRQASTQIQTSIISVTVKANETNIEPGSTIFILFSVATTNNGVTDKSATESFRVRVNNDRSYSSTSPSTLTVEAASGGIANGTVTLTVPASAASGTDVTLTIEVENEPGSDMNYSVLRFSVAAKVTDISRPVCQISTSARCPPSPSLCASSQWVFIANITDGINGTGIESVTIRRGDGTLSTSIVAGTVGENVTVATYSASCCSQNVELAIVDSVGNVAACVGQAVVNTASIGAHTLSTSNMLIGVVVSFLCRYKR